VLKKWDRATFARHGWSKKAAVAIKAKGKKRKKAYASDEENWDDEEVLEDEDDGEDVLLDQSFDPSAPVLPIKWEADAEARKTWEYPVQPDKELRTYQYDIVHRALFENTLVSLPTGLGKTFIAACVM
jgi:superfamily II DNA or RNA helicase